MKASELISKLQSAQQLHGDMEFTDEAGNPVLPETRKHLRYLGEVKKATDAKALDLLSELGVVKGFGGTTLNLSGADGLIVEIDKDALFGLIRALETLAP
ncbi:MAG: hypothetical protein ACREQ5_03260 [Candidatus Dormibacteria bacterium]